MKRALVVIAVTMLASVCGLHAQDANPISTNLKHDWSNISGLFSRMADKMPAEDYRFKPTPEVQDFGQRMAHVITFNMRFCSMLKGEQKPLKFSAMPTKAEITMAMKEANDECDSLFNSLTDTDLHKMVGSGLGGQRMELTIIQGPILEHSQEMYGYMAVYLRLKGVVPPSSERNER